MKCEQDGKKPVHNSFHSKQQQKLKLTFKMAFLFDYLYSYLKIYSAYTVPIAIIMKSSQTTHSYSGTTRIQAKA